MSQVVRSLKILNLSYSLELMKTPDFGGLLSLESLLLEGCLSLTQVCESIGSLERLVLLNMSGCTSLKKIPCLPRSLVSLKMDGCSNLGGLGQVQILDSFSQFSLLVDINVSQCNLFDNSFPEDWSELFSLKSLNIGDNHITSLPGCVKSLPSLESLYATNCSHLQSVLDVPKSVTNLYAGNNMALEIVQPPPHPFFFHTTGCKKLCAVEGCFKLVSIKKVDRIVKRYLGLESISENGFGSGCNKQNAYTEEDSIKILYEFGILSTIISGKTLPSFMYKETGPTISFRVPSHSNGSRITGLNVCFMATCYNYEGPEVLSVKVNNKTKALVWSYTPTIYETKYQFGKPNYVWLSLWRTGNLLDDGDEVVVSIETYEAQMDIVEEWCVNFVYDDDDDEEEILDGQKKETHCISWTDRLQVEVSNYVHSGKRYFFSSRQLPVADESYYILVDWWGIKAHQKHRFIFACHPASIHLVYD